jgi:hypothetical protein
MTQTYYSPFYPDNGSSGTKGSTIPIITTGEVTIINSAVDALDTRITNIEGGSLLDTTAPGTVTGLALSSSVAFDTDGSQIVTLSAIWNGVSDLDLQNYELAIQENSGTFIEFVSGKSSLKYDWKVRANQSFNIKIRAVDTSGNRSAWSAIVSLTSAKDTVAPSAPTGLSILSGLSSLFIKWQNPTDIDLSRILIYENTINNSSTATLIAAVNGSPSDPGAYTRSGLTSGVTLYYWLKAEDTSGNTSSFSTVVSSTTNLITLPDFSSSLKPVEKVTLLPIAGTSGRIVFLTTDNKLYRDTGSSWISTTAASDVTGQLTSTQIADSSILSAKIAANAITVTQMADNAITTAKIASGAVDSSILAANAVISSKIAANAITVTQMADNAITTAKIVVGAVDSSILAANAVTLAKFATGLTPVEVVATLPSTGNFTGRTVSLTTDGKLYRYFGGQWLASIPANDITGTITTTQITDNAITTAKVAANAITATQIAANTITASQIATGTITASQIATGTITASQIATGTITATKLAVGDYENLIKDPEFYDTNYWYTTGGGLSTVADVTGTGATQLASRAAYTTATPNGTTTQGAAWVCLLNTGPQYLPVEPLKSYRISGKVLVKAGFNGVLYAYGYFFAGDRTTSLGAVGPTICDYRTVACTVDTIIEYSNVAATVANTAFLRVGIYGGWSTTLASTGIAYVTSPRVQRMASGELIVDGSVTAIKIAANTITASQIAAGAITATQIATGTITATQIAASTITAAKIATGTITAGLLAANAITADKLIVGSVGQSLVLNGGAESADISGWKVGGYTSAGSTFTATTTALKSGAYGFELTKTAVGNQASGRCRSMSVQGLKNYAVKISLKGSASSTVGVFVRIYWFSAQVNGFGTTQVSTQDLTSWSDAAASTSYTEIERVITAPATAKFAEIEVINYINGPLSLYFDDVEFYQQTTTAMLADGVVTAAKIVANTITAGQIAANTITAGQIAANTITASQIASGTITATQISAGTITATEIAATTITGAKLVAGTITATQIASGTITATQIAAGTITGNKLVAGTITSNEIAANTITASQIAANTITASQIAASTITASQIAANTITASQIAANSISGDRISTSTSLPGTITIGATGVTLSTIQSQANDPAARVNANSTIIDPGKILVSGATTLANWRNGSDSTKIEGGAIAANTITANKIAVGLREIDTSISFDTNRSNQVSWNGGYIRYMDDNGNSAVVSVSAGSATWPGTGWVYIWWNKGSTVLNYGPTDFNNINDVQLARYYGGTNLNTIVGRTIIDGDYIKTGTINANHIGVNSLSAITADLGTITAGTIIFNNGSYMKVQGTGFGTTNQFIEWYGPSLGSITSCSESNAISYLKVNGQAYFGGGLSSGVLKNSGTGTTVSNTAEVIVGPFSSNGNTININASASYRRTQSSSTGGVTITGAGSGNITIERSSNGTSWTSLSTIGVNENERINGAAANENSIWGMNGATTTTWTPGTGTTYYVKVRWSSFTLPTITGSNLNPATEVQLTTAICVETA